MFMCYFIFSFCNEVILILFMNSCFSCTLSLIFFPLFIMYLQFCLFLFFRFVYEKDHPPSVWLTSIWTYIAFAVSFMV